MKTLVLVCVAIASVSGLGSGPYLPSGWKPEGPAFLLPSEVQKPVPLKDAPLQETEGSGSDALREYGPPKFDVSQDLTQQALPDTVTEQSFFIINAKFNDEIRDSDDSTDSVTEDVFSEQSGAIKEETASLTESQVSDEKAAEPIVRGKSLDIETETIVEKTSEVSEQEVDAKQGADLATVQEETLEKTAEEGAIKETESLVKTSVVTSAQKVETSAQSADLTTVQEVETFVKSSDVATTQQVESSAQNEDLASVQAEETSAQNADLATETETLVKTSEVATTQEESSKNAEVTQEEITSVSAVEAEVEIGELNNIADKLISLEKEIQAEQEQAKIVQEVAELKTLKETLGAVSVPEGFLEYGPPGFREYGPPKEESGLLRTAAIIEANQNIDDTVESNETRRRRYSPKFRASRRIH